MKGDLHPAAFRLANLLKATTHLKSEKPKKEYTKTPQFNKRGKRGAYIKI